MKRLLLAALIAGSLASPAQAKAPDATIYKVYHYGVYVPTMAVCFLFGAPVVIAGAIVQHYEEKLKPKAVVEPSPAVAAPSTRIKE